MNPKKNMNLKNIKFQRFKFNGKYEGMLNSSLPSRLHIWHV